MSKARKTQSSSSKKITISEYKELPIDIRALVIKSGIKKRDAVQYLDVLVSVLRFKTKKNIIYTKETRYGESLRRHDGHSLISEEICSVNPFDEEAEELLDQRFRKFFKSLQPLGKGGYGSVFLAKTKKGKQVAIKQISHDEKSGDKYIRRNFQEIRFLKYCRNQSGIVKYYKSFIKNKKMWIITEYLNGSDLGAVRSFGLEEADIAYIVYKVLKGLRFLHDNFLAHRDIKCGNIMCTLDGKIKLIDFGLCTDVSQGELLTMVGSPHYMSPEMISRKPHSLPVDIWAIGILAAILANGGMVIKDQIKSMFFVGAIGIDEPLKHPRKFSADFRDFLSLCLKHDPAERATVLELMEHPYLQTRAEKKRMLDVFKGLVISNHLTFAM